MANPDDPGRGPHPSGPNGARHPERHFTHVSTLFSVSAGMIGADLTGIGLVQLVTHSRRLSTICDDLLVIDAGLFGLVSLLCYASLGHQVRQREWPLDRWIDRVFLVAQGLMLGVCGLFAWSVL